MPYNTCSGFGFINPIKVIKKIKKGKKDNTK